MTQKKLPPHIVLQESKEVIFYLENPLPSEITIPTWMKSFPDDYKGMIMTNACLFKRLKDHSWIGIKCLRGKDGKTKNRDTSFPLKSKI